MKSPLRAAVLIASLAAPMFAAQSSTRVTPRQTGTVQAINKADKQIVFIDDSGAKTTRKFSEQVVISDGRQALGIADLNPGDAVAVTTDAKGEVIDVSVSKPTKT